MIHVGSLELQTVSGGRLWIDGGNMFGVVPKVLWQDQCPPDDRNRIPLETNCLLVRSANGLALIDTGYGQATPRLRENHSLKPGRPLVENLLKNGVEPDAIDLVVLTHLHFDHAGGCTSVDDSGQTTPTFSRARYVVQESEWEDATADQPELAGCYFKRHFAPLEKAGQLQLIRGDTELLPGMSTRLTRGHTRGHQMISFKSGDRRAVYLADLCPTSAHLSTFWGMAYDQEPLTLPRIKPVVLGEAADNDWLVLFEHDPAVRAAFLSRDEKREFVVREEVAL